MELCILLAGAVTKNGDTSGLSEAPHLYKRNGYYYLLTAEGGTGWGHAVTMARSRKLTGPYELHPDVYILTSRNRPDVELQRAGHADLVETPNGETYMVHLCEPRVHRHRRLILGLIYSMRLSNFRIFRVPSP